jgi:ATP-dependent RNA helicase RhlE
MQNIRTAKGSFVRKNSQSNFRSRGNNRTFGPNRNSRAKGENNIDINAFIERNARKAIESTTPKVVIKHEFVDFGFVTPLNINLNKRGYLAPTAIQDQTILAVIGGRDMIGLANTGTGKTAAFLLPFINKVYLDRSQKVLIIAPTRELALQIEDELRQFAWGMKIFYTSCVGGLPIGKQINSLRMRQDFVIGTPGRLKDLASRGFIKFSDFNNVVLDEVDRMLDMGFVDEIKYFLSQLPKERQSLFFSATLPDKIARLTESFAKNPITVRVTTGETAANVHQEVIKTNRFEKKTKLHEILAKPGMDKVLIFSETKRDVEKLAVELVEQGFLAESIHGDKRQGQRVKALRDFKDERVKILVATDVAARGLDIKDVSHVINYTTPKTYDDYIHRIGRTGRGSSLGVALTFVE